MFYRSYTNKIGPFFLSFCCCFLLFFELAFANKSGGPRSSRGKKSGAAREGEGIYKKPSTPSEEKERKEILERTPSLKTQKTPEKPEEKSEKKKEAKGKISEIKDLMTEIKKSLTTPESEKISISLIFKIPLSLRNKFLESYHQNKSIEKHKKIFEQNLERDSLIYLEVCGDLLTELESYKQTIRDLSKLEEEKPKDFGPIKKINFSEELPEKIEFLHKKLREFLNKISTNILTSMIVFDNSSTEDQHILRNHIIMILEELKNQKEIQDNSIVKKLLDYSLVLFQKITPEKNKEKIKEQLNSFLEKIRKSPIYIDFTKFTFIRNLSSEKSQELLNLIPDLLSVFSEGKRIERVISDLENHLQKMDKILPSFEEKFSFLKEFIEFIFEESSSAYGTNQAFLNKVFATSYGHSLYFNFPEKTLPLDLSSSTVNWKMLRILSYLIKKEIETKKEQKEEIQKVFSPIFTKEVQTEELELIFKELFLTKQYNSLINNNTRIIFLLEKIFKKILKTSEEKKLHLELLTSETNTLTSQEQKELLSHTIRLYFIISTPSKGPKDFKGLEISAQIMEKYLPTAQERNVFFKNLILSIIKNTLGEKIFFSSVSDFFRKNNTTPYLFIIPDIEKIEDTLSNLVWRIIRISVLLEKREFEKKRNIKNLDSFLQEIVALEKTEEEKIKGIFSFFDLIFSTASLSTLISNKKVAYFFSKFFLRDVLREKTEISVNTTDLTLHDITREQRKNLLEIMAKIIKHGQGRLEQSEKTIALKEIITTLLEYPLTLKEKITFFKELLVLILKQNIDKVNLLSDIRVFFFNNSKEKYFFNFGEGLVLEESIASLSWNIIKILSYLYETEFKTKEKLELVDPDFLTFLPKEKEETKGIFFTKEHLLDLFQNINSSSYTLMKSVSSNPLSTLLKSFISSFLKEFVKGYEKEQKTKEERHIEEKDLSILKELSSLGEELSLELYEIIYSHELNESSLKGLFSQLGITTTKSKTEKKRKKSSFETLSSLTQYLYSKKELMDSEEKVSRVEDLIRKIVRKLYLLNPSEAKVEIEKIEQNISFSSEISKKIIEIATQELTLIQKIDSYNIDKVKYTPRLYQKESILFLLTRERAILADEMGLGKTFVTLAAIENLKLKRTTPTLWIGPGNVLEQVKRELASSLSLPKKVLVIEKSSDLYGQNFASYDYILFSYDLLSLNIDSVKHLKWDVIVVDESQNIGNTTTQRTEGVKELSSKYLWFLSASPWRSKLDQLRVQLSLLFPENPLYQNKELYRKEFEQSSLGFIKLKRHLKNVMIRHSLREIVSFFTPENEGKTYKKQLENDAIAHMAKLEIKDEEYVLSTYQQREYENQQREKSSFFEQVKKLTRISLYSHDSNSPFMKKLLESLKGIEEKGENVVIWTHYLEDLNNIHKALTEAYPNYDILKFTGTENKGQRQQAIEAFQGSKKKILLATIESGGVGLTLTNADLMIYTGIPYLYEYYQANGRVQRLITPDKLEYAKEKVRVVRLISTFADKSQQTLEELKRDYLKAKYGLFRLIMDGAIKGDIDSLQQSLQKKLTSSWEKKISKLEPICK